MDKIFTEKDFVNYAEDPKIREEARQLLHAAYNACKVNRRPMELDWMRYHKIWAMKRGERQSYNGRADLRHATPRRAIETVARKLHSTILPDDDYFNVLPKPGMAGSTYTAAEGVKNLTLHYFEGPSKIKTKMIPFFRQLALLGTSAVKTGWKKEIVPHRKRGKIKQITRFDCPNIYTVDIFRFYVFPWNVRDLDEVKITFEEFAQDKHHVERMVDSGWYVKDHNLGVFVKYTYDQQARLLQWGHNDPSVYRNHKNDIYNLVECYFTMEIDGELRPLMAHMDEFGNIAMIVDHPYDHCDFPYSSAQYVQNQVPFFYGIGAMEILESLANEQNDIANQIMDNKTMILNPIALVDPYLVRDHASLKLAPAAKWLVDPNGVKFTAMPDLTASGMQAFQLVKNEILEASDAVPNLPPQMRGAGRTASRDRAVNVEMNSELSEFIRQITLCMEDIVRKTHSNERQFVEEDQIIRILKKKQGDFAMAKVSLDDISADYDFSWRSSIKTQLDRVQVQQLINAIGVLAQGGVKLNMEHIAKRLLRDGFGFDDYEEVLASEGSAPPSEQDIENVIIKMGRVVPIHPNDNDEEHLKLLDEEFGKGKNYGKEVEHAIDDHRQRHIDGMKIKQEVAKRAVMEAEMARIQQQGMAPAGEAGAVDMANMPQGTGEGNVEQGMRVS